MSALNRKLFRDLRRLGGQVITIALVVAAGIASYVTMRSTFESLDRMRTSYYERYRFADAFATLKRAPDAVAGRIAAIPGVALVHTRVVKDIMLPVDGLPEPAIGRLISIPTDRAIPLNGVLLRSGRMPEPRQDDEVVVMESFANAHGLVAGDRLPAVINGKHRELQIVGVGMSPEYIFAAAAGDFAPDDRRMAIMWMDHDVLAPAFQMDGAFNDVSLRLQPGASPLDVIAAVDRILEPYGGLGAVGRDKQTSNFMLSGEMSQLEAFATMFPIIFLGVAAFLLNVVLARLISLQRQQIAVLEALGYSSWHIALHFLQLVSIIVVLGALVGVALGAWLGSGMTELYSGFFRFPSNTYHLTFSVVVVGIGVSLFAAVVGALGAVRRVMRLPPAEAMRPPAPASYKASLLERLGIARIIGTSAMMVLRELRRRPMRTILSSLGIAASIGILVVGWFLTDSMEYLIDTIMHEEQPGDMMVGFIEPIPASAVREIEHLPGVLDSEGFRAVPVRFRAGQLHRDSVINGLPPEPRLRRVIDRQARLVAIPREGLAISRKLGEIMGVGIGDTLQVEVREGERPVHHAVVSALVDDSFGLQGYMSMDALHRLLGQETAVSIVYIAPDKVHIDELHRRLKELPKVGQVTRKENLVQRFREQSGQWMWVFAVILSFFGAVIAIGVVYNNARVALSMRSRDLASLRVLGFTRREISAVLLGELAVQMIVALPFGLWLGKAWAISTMSTVDPEIYRMPVIISNRTYAIAILVTILAGIGSALLVRRKLDHLDLIGVLKTRE